MRGGGVNHGRPHPKAFSFSSALSSLHAHTPRLRAFLQCLSAVCMRVVALRVVVVLGVL